MALSCPAEWEKYLELPVSKVPFIVLDTETTGLEKTARVHQIGAVKLLDGEVEEDNAFSHKLNFYDDHQPANLVPGYDYDELYDCPSFKDLVEEYLEFASHGVLLAHNEKFDRARMNYELKLLGKPSYQYRWLDTKNLAKQILVDEELANLDLDTIAEVLDVPAIDDEDRHMALPDAIFTAECLKELLYAFSPEGSKTFKDVLTSTKYKNV